MANCFLIMAIPFAICTFSLKMYCIYIHIHIWNICDISAEIFDDRTRKSMEKRRNILIKENMAKYVNTKSILYLPKVSHFDNSDIPFVSTVVSDVWELSLLPRCACVLVKPHLLDANVAVFDFVFFFLFVDKTSIIHISWHIFDTFSIGFLVRPLKMFTSFIVSHRGFCLFLCHKNGIIDYDFADWFFSFFFADRKSNILCITKHILHIIIIIDELWLESREINSVFWNSSSLSRI